MKGIIIFLINLKTLIIKIVENLLINMATLFDRGCLKIGVKNVDKCQFNFQSNLKLSCIIITVAKTRHIQVNELNPSLFTLIANLFNPINIAQHSQGFKVTNDE